ncbi:hypothetical protein [Oceanobacillus indicireducens]|uniref:Uncharacterized protein n=1 Tax=Oceanobacillus indicireducens TaxID=1004261 RepID=A0A917Y453_9BACI|nr:hypothetical protein [Oceanobacillus indicireducens]GGN64320.1 hypothetical protein GCM10007971_32070 [Oceanobacillus indicireducens]
MSDKIFRSEPIINEDEMFGFIMRKASENGEKLDFDSVVSVLAYQIMFYQEKGLIDDEKKVI